MRITAAAYSVVALAALSVAHAQTLQPFMASLHAHTDYSDSVHQWLPLIAPESASPAKAFAYALWPGGLQIMATTDHAETLSPYALDNQLVGHILGQDLVARHKTPNEWADTLAQAAAVTRPGTFVALRGFEWTGDAIPGQGHINVIGSQEYTGAHSFTPDAADMLSPTLASFYAWLADHATAIDGGTPVCQFNHPDRYATPAPPFADFAYNPLVDPYFALLEIGNGYDPDLPFSIPDVGYQGPSHNERWFIRALDQGWHVAPTNNQDNHTGHYGNQNSHRTGVWATELTATAVMDALRQRRVFATEDANLVCALWAGPDGPSPSLSYFMGARDVPASAELGLRIQLSAPTLDLASVEVLTVGGNVAWQASPASMPPKGARVAEWRVTLPYAQPQVHLAVTPAASLAVTLDASATIATGPIRETYYFVRVRESRGASLYTAPVWVQPASAWRPTSYTWSFGDGSPTYTESANNAPDGSFDGKTTHVYPASGTYNGTLTVDGPGGVDTSASWQVHVGATMPGDVNGDGLVGIGDAVLALRAVLKLVDLSPSQVAAADVAPAGGDGHVSLADVVRLLQMAIGI